MPKTARHPGGSGAGQSERDGMRAIGTHLSGTIHGIVTAAGVELTWTLPEPVRVSDHETVGLLADVIVPGREGIEIAAYLTPEHATGCLTALETPRPRELEQTDIAYTADGSSFTATFPHRWLAGVRRDPTLVGGVSVDGGSPLRLGGLLETERRIA